MILRSMILCLCAISLGCGHQEKIESLSAEVVDLQQDVVTLKAAQKDLCMMSAELSTDSRMLYLGDDVWMNKETGSAARVPDLETTCLEMLEVFKQEVESRLEMRQVIEEKLKSIPVVLQ